MVDVVGTQRSHSRRGRRGPWSMWSERSLTDRRSDAVWRFDRRPSGVVGLSRCPNRWMSHERQAYDLGFSLDGLDGTLSSSFDAARSAARGSLCSSTQLADGSDDSMYLDSDVLHYIRCIVWTPPSIKYGTWDTVGARLMPPVCMQICMS